LDMMVKREIPSKPYKLIFVNTMICSFCQAPCVLHLKYSFSPRYNNVATAHYS